MSAVDSRTDHVARLDDTGTAGQGERVAFLVGAGRSGTTLLYKLL